MKSKFEDIRSQYREFPSDRILLELRVGDVPGEVFAYPSTDGWFEPTPDCVHCSRSSVCEIVWRTTRYELRPVLSQASLERGPEYHVFPDDHSELVCEACVYSALIDAACDPERDHTYPITVEASYWWLTRGRDGGVA